MSNATSHMKTWSPTNAIGLGVFALLTACWAPAFAQERQASQSLVQRTSYGSDCPPPHQDFNNKIMMYGRVVASSTAFPERLREKLRSDYRKCNADPFYSANLDTQIEKALAVSRSFNTLHIRCTGGSGNASAGGGSYGHPDEESFSWSGWFGRVFDSLPLPLCVNGATEGCRAGPEPWPYSQAAGIVWHEVMHSHGYGHGHNSDQALARSGCGYPGDTTWDFQRNTMPYIVGDAITDVIIRSSAVCGNMESCPSSRQLNIVAGFNGTTCICVPDPASAGLGILEVGGTEVVDTLMLPNGDWVGGWHFDITNNVTGADDYDGDGADDLVVRSRWGLGILKATGSGLTPLLVVPNGTRFGGWQLDSSNDQIDTLNKDIFTPAIARLGSDFNGDVRDDLLIRSGWGIALLTLNRSGLTPLVIAANGTSLGGWILDSRNDKIQKIGDFNGDNMDDILITSRWGLGILKLNGSTLIPAMAAPNGTSLGGWFLNVTGPSSGDATDSIAGVGDFNDDGKDDIVIKSRWGMAILTLEGSTLTPLMAAPNGTSFGGWQWSISDEMYLGDFNRDGKTDILVKSNWGLGILSFNSRARSLSLLMAAPNAASLDGWYFDARNDRLAAIRDRDSDGSDIFIQSPWGIGTLTLRGTTLRRLSVRPWRTLAGSWPLTPEDLVLQFGRYQQSPRAQLLVQKDRTP